MTSIPRLQRPVSMERTLREWCITTTPNSVGPESGHTTEPAATNMRRPETAAERRIRSEYNFNSKIRNERPDRPTPSPSSRPKVSWRASFAVWRGHDVLQIASFIHTAKRPPRHCHQNGSGGNAVQGAIGESSRRHVRHSGTSFFNRSMLALSGGPSH